MVNCRILCDNFTGVSKGVGFVLFDRKSQAEQAIAAWNNVVPPGGTEVRHGIILINIVSCWRFNSAGTLVEALTI